MRTKLLFMICAFGFFISSNVSAAVSPDDGRIVTVRALELGKLRNLSVDSLSLKAMKNGKLVPIPSQIDEMTEEGYVYFEEGKYKNSGESGIFDQQDVLMFMLKDAGENKGRAKVLDGTLLAEIEVTFMTGKKAMSI